MKNSKSNNGKSNPITMANREDIIMESLSKIMVASGYSAICPSYNPETNEFNYESDKLAKGMFVRILGQLVRFAEANESLVANATKPKSRFSRKSTKVSETQQNAVAQHSILEENGFFEIAENLQATIDSYYPPKA
tara:strand:- start:5662 stop:6069 length:408 start_codon:yes stop_codon:yes gene_type:complete